MPATASNSTTAPGNPYRSPSESPRDAWIKSDQALQAKQPVQAESAPRVHPCNDSLVLSPFVMEAGQDYHVAGNVGQDYHPEVGQDYHPAELTARAYDLARAFGDTHRPDRREHTRNCLRLLARIFLKEFGRGHTADEFRPMVEDWYRGPDIVETPVPEKIFDWFADYFGKQHSVTYAEVVARATAATQDASLSEGLPERIVSHDRANRTARFLRYMHRHYGEPFRLSYLTLQNAIGLPSENEAGRVAFRVEKAGLVERLEHGTSPKLQLPRSEWKATVYQWTGPA